MQKIFAAAVIVFVGVSVVTADEFFGAITKVDGNKLSITKFKKGEKGEDVTLTVSDSVKVVKAKFNKETKKLEAGEALEGGLKNEMFAKIGEKGRFATVVTNADNTKIVEIRVFGRKGK